MYAHIYINTFPATSRHIKKKGGERGVERTKKETPSVQIEDLFK